MIKYFTLNYLKSYLPKITLNQKDIAMSPFI